MRSPFKIEATKPIIWAVISALIMLHSILWRDIVKLLRFKLNICIYVSVDAIMSLISCMVVGASLVL